MTKQEIVLSDKVKNISNDDYDAIKEAITKLSSASEDQFETIKKEKWYNRVFDLITFSKKNQKRLADQISTVAQANQILMELLLRLSENDKNISELVCKSLDDIRKLQSQDIYLLSLIKRLEDSALGIRKDTDIDILSAESKNILCACLYHISEKYANSSDNQKKFFNSICSYIRTDGVQMDNPYELFSRLDTDTQFRIFFACMEYFFLYDCSENSYDKYEEEIVEFDIGIKTIRQVKQQINALYDARGVEGFVNKFESYDNKGLMDNFFIEFDDFPQNDEIIEDNDSNRENSKILPMTIDYSANENETISSILLIEKGEKLVYKNKNIHIKAYIKCDGELEFQNCVIYYNEYESGDEIQLGEDASIVFDGCMIYCKGYDESVFITNTNYCKNKFTFKNSSFYDCVYFIKLENVSGAIIENCYFCNCFIGFIDIQLGEDAEFIMNSNYYKLDGFSAFNEARLKSVRSYHDSIINIDSSFLEDMKDLYISNMLIEESLDEQNEAKKAEFTIIKANRIKLQQSTLLGLTKEVVFWGAYKCYFKDCIKGLGGSGVYRKISEIDNCLFDNCTNVIRINNSISINSSIFISCYGKFINPYFSSIKILNCQFYNIKFKLPALKLPPTIRRACIAVGESGSSIKKCVFDGIELDNGDLISGNRRESSCDVSECYFLNWKKGDSDKIIYEHFHYFGMFGKLKTVKSIFVSSDCKGLDKSSGSGVSDKSLDEIYNMCQHKVGSNINN